MNVAAQRITINREIHFFSSEFEWTFGTTLERPVSWDFVKIDQKNGFEEPILWRVLDLKSLDDHFWVSFGHFWSEQCFWGTFDISKKLIESGNFEYEKFINLT